MKRGGCLILAFLLLPLTGFLPSISADTSNLIEADISQDHITNPFSTAISLYGNSGGSLSSTEYTIPIRNADGMYLDSKDNDLYVIVRYIGDPAPISAITLSFS